MIAINKSNIRYIIQNSCLKLLDPNDPNKFINLDPSLLYENKPSR